MLSVFVYGTLKPGEAYFETFCELHVEKWLPAQTPGHLFHLPLGYPALTVDTWTGEPATDSWVQGALLHFWDEDAIAEIDAFEDYDPALPAGTNLYVRQLRSVFSLNYEPLGNAWMYVMQAERVLQQGGVPIPEGLWTREQWPSIAPDR